MRVFSSAPILKAFDVFTLETIDGICVVLKGFINKTHSEENGFPSEVCYEGLAIFVCLRNLFVDCEVYEFNEGQNKMRI